MRKTLKGVYVQMHVQYWMVEGLTQTEVFVYKNVCIHQNQYLDPFRNHGFGFGFGFRLRSLV